MSLNSAYDFKILDHGFLRSVESYGSDESIVEAARQSNGKGFLGWDPGPCPICAGVPVAMDVCLACEGKGVIRGDKYLLKYLHEKMHSTPFEMAGLIIDVQAPILVFREWHRHRSQAFSEMSARYTPLPDLNYIPSVERLLLNSKTNKQAGTIKGAEELTPEKAESYRKMLAAMYQQQEGFYQEALLSGVPKELARIHLPVGRYSKMRAHANLRNWLAFLTLRMAPDAQWEIRQFANAVGEIIKGIYPRTWALFVGEASW